MVRYRMEDAEGEEEYAPEAGPSGEYAESGEQLTDEVTGAVAPRSMPSAGDCRPFDQFDQLAVSFVAGSMCVCRPVPLKHASDFRQNVKMVRDVVRRIVRIRDIRIGAREAELLLVDRPLGSKVLSEERSPLEDLRLADQMLRLVMAGSPREYSYWHLQFYLASDVGKLLGRDADGWGEENMVIIRKVEAMTCTRITVAPYDPLAWRRAFLLTGEQELVERAVGLLSGAIQQKLAPTGEDVASVSAWGGVEEDDGRLEEIQRSLKSQHGLSMHEVERDGNCLFRAMSKWEWSSQKHHRRMRETVVEHLAANPEAMELPALVEGMSTDDYLRSMREDGHWGGFTELMAYAEKFSRSVRLYVENPSIGLRAIEHEVAGSVETDRIQLLLYRSHYWLLEPTHPMGASAF